MKKGKFESSGRRGFGGKTVALLLALVLVVGGVIGGTLAWLTDKTDPVTNTFTVGNIDITLTETTGTSYKMVPGNTITKDPKVTVKGGSEACYLFVKVEEENWPTFTESDGTRKVKYGIADGWTALTGETGVYYREVRAVTADTSFDVLAGNVVTVSENLTKTEVSGITTQPKLTFTAYAVQKDGITDAGTAWTKANPTTNP